MTSSRRRRRCSCPPHPHELRQRSPSIVSSSAGREEQRPLFVKSEHDVSNHFSVKSRREPSFSLASLEGISDSSSAMYISFSYQLIDLVVFLLY
jgi:hypothetical protein